VEKKKNEGDLSRRQERMKGEWNGNDGGGVNECCNKVMVGLVLGNVEEGRKKRVIRLEFRTKSMSEEEKE